MPQRVSVDLARTMSRALQDVSKCVGDPCPNGRMVETVARVKVEVWRCATDDVEPRVWLIVASERKE